MIIMAVEMLKENLVKIWKSELLKIINSKSGLLLNLTIRFLRQIYETNFLLDFYQWKKVGFSTRPKS